MTRDPSERRQGQEKGTGKEADQGRGVERDKDRERGVWNRERETGSWPPATATSR